MKTTTYINLFGGPGVGKSTMAAKLFHHMKTNKYDVELVTEVAKDFVWENRISTLDIQPYVTIKQYRNLMRLKGKVQYVITDAPLLLGIMYGREFGNVPNSYFEFLSDLHDDFLNPSINILLTRKFDYDANGRLQTEDDARILDKKIENILSEFTNFVKVPAGNEKLIMKELI